MDSGAAGTLGVKTDDEKARHAKRVKLRELNATTVIEGGFLSAYTHYNT